MRPIPASLTSLLRSLLCFRSSSSNGDPPTVAWLLEHRSQRPGQAALTKGQTPGASLYRMYEYLVVGYITGLRSEFEFFFNQPTWAVSAIPDPDDTDPARYAILAVLTQYLVIAFNRLIERGLPRGSPAIITGADVEDELRAQAKVLEQEPDWTKKVARLQKELVLLGAYGEIPDEGSRSSRFREMNIIVEEPHVLFV